MIEVRSAGTKGLGVFATRDMSADILVERVWVHPIKTKYLQDGPHWEHVFPWDREHWALAVGYAHFINHSDDPNCYWWIDRRRQTCTIKTMRAVDKDEELTIDYCFTGEPGFTILD